MHSHSFIGVPKWKFLTSKQQKRAPEVDMVPFMKTLTVVMSAISVDTGPSCYSLSPLSIMQCEMQKSTRLERFQLLEIHLKHFRVSIVYLEETLKFVWIHYACFCYVTVQSWLFTPYLTLVVVFCYCRTSQIYKAIVHEMHKLCEMSCSNNENCSMFEHNASKMRRKRETHKK